MNHFSLSRLIGVPRVKLMSAIDLHFTIFGGFERVKGRKVVNFLRKTDKTAERPSIVVDVIQ